MFRPLYNLEIMYGIHRLGDWGGQKVVLDVLDVREKRKISSTYGDSNPGPSST